MSLLPIVGGRYRPPADTVLGNLPGDTPLILVREPENQHDPNAIKVCLPVGWGDAMSEEHKTQLNDAVSLTGHEINYDEEFHLGYIPRDLAAAIAGQMDETGENVSGTLGFDPSGRGVFQTLDDDEIEEEIEGLDEEDSTDLSDDEVRDPNTGE